MKKAGAGVPSANRITLLRDADGDGVAEMRTVFLEGLNSPFGMALVGNDFYVANTDAVVRFPYIAGRRRGSPAPGTKVVDLPGGTLNHHWTKNLIASRDGTQALRDGRLEQQRRRERHGRARKAAPRSGRSTRRRGTHARLRLGPAQPERPGLGAADAARCGPSVNERDELGSDLVPDYLTSVRDGGFYGWPYSYYGQHVDDARQAAAARPGRQGDRARLRARPAHRVARAWPSTTARCCPRASRAACSSASTARGTASRAAATR